MQDRNVQFPKRFRLTPVSGITGVYDLDAVPGDIYNEGSPLNKATFLKDATARSFGLDPATAVPDDIFSKLNVSFVENWTKITEFLNPGAFQWTPPDLNKGKPYPVGVYALGGGGGGGVCSCYYNEGKAIALGGAGGYGSTGIIQVSPGVPVNLVVGTGGTGGTGRGTTGAVVQPTAGGTSSIGSVYAGGGGGGPGADKAYDENDLTVGPALGGQNSPCMTFSNFPGYYGWYPLTGGIPVPGQYSAPSGSAAGSRQFMVGIAPGSSLNCWNPFEYRVMPISAGGGLSYVNSSSKPQPATLYSPGTGAGAASAEFGGTGGNGVYAGAGGGAAHGEFFSGKHKGGNGAPGAIYLYVRGKY